MDSGIHFNYRKVSLGMNKTALDLRSVQVKTQEKIAQGELVRVEGIMRPYGYQSPMLDYVHRMMKRTPSYELVAVVSDKYGLEIPAAVLGDDPYICPLYNDAFMLSLVFLYANKPDWGLIERSLRKLRGDGVISPLGVNIPNAAILLTIRDIYVSNRDPTIENKIAGYVESRDFSAQCLRLGTVLRADKISAALLLGLKEHLFDEPNKVIAGLESN